MADKTTLSELQSKLQVILKGSKAHKDEGRKGPKANKPIQVARDIRKNFRKTK